MLPQLPPEIWSLILKWRSVIIRKSLAQKFLNAMNTCVYGGLWRSESYWLLISEYIEKKDLEKFCYFYDNGVVKIRRKIN